MIPKETEREIERQMSRYAERWLPLALQGKKASRVWPSWPVNE